MHTTHQSPVRSGAVPIQPILNSRRALRRLPPALTPNAATAPAAVAAAIAATGQHTAESEVSAPTAASTTQEAEAHMAARRQPCPTRRRLRAPAAPRRAASAPPAPQAQACTARRHRRPWVRRCPTSRSLTRMGRRVGRLTPVGRSGRALPSGRVRTSFDAGRKEESDVVIGRVPNGKGRGSEAYNGTRV